MPGHTAPRRAIKSIREGGWTIPVIVDYSGGFVAGHARLLAARKLGWVDVPVMVASGWSEAQKRAYVLADNDLAMKAGIFNGRRPPPIFRFRRLPCRNNG